MVKFGLILVANAMLLDLFRDLRAKSKNGWDIRDYALSTLLMIGVNLIILGLPLP